MCVCFGKNLRPANLKEMIGLRKKRACDFMELQNNHYHITVELHVLSGRTAEIIIIKF